MDTGTYPHDMDAAILSPWDWSGERRGQAQARLSNTESEWGHRWQVCGQKVGGTRLGKPAAKLSLTGFSGCQKCCSVQKAEVPPW